MHQPYELLQKHPADFRVKYKLLLTEEGGRKTPPYQGIRWDFSYDMESQLYMVWPEFETETGDLIMNNNQPVNTEGTARMWILNPQLRPFHQKKIVVGLKCFFREGKVIGNCEVIEILGLFDNPTE